MTITKDKLYADIARLGAAGAAADGSFHELASGGGASSNVRMIRARVQGITAGKGELLLDVNDSGDYPFVQAWMLNPSAGTGYTVDIQAITPASVLIKVNAFDLGEEVENPPNLDVFLGVRIEEFIETL